MKPSSYTTEICYWLVVYSLVVLTKISATVRASLCMHTPLQKYNPDPCMTYCILKTQFVASAIYGIIIMLTQ